MQDFFQQFISFLLDSWKSLIFLFVFSFGLKETIERTLLKTIRLVTHLIIDYSDKTVSLFYNKEWKADNYKDIFFFITTNISLGKMKNEKIYLKYENLINRYKKVVNENLLYSLLLNSKLSSKVTTKTEKNLRYIEDISGRLYKNQFTLITFLLILELRFFLFKISIYPKFIYVLTENNLINNFKKITSRYEIKPVKDNFKEHYDIQLVPPINYDLSLLNLLSWYSFSQFLSKKNGIDFNVLSDQKKTELFNSLKESDFIKDITFDVFISNDREEKPLNTNYQILKSPNFSEINRKRYNELVDKGMMLEVKKTVEYGDEYLCPVKQELNYKYTFISNIQINEVIQLIDYYEGELKIYISEGSAEESLVETLISKSITKEKNYFYLSRLEQLKKKIDNVFKYIEYALIVIYFVISIFIEQNYFDFFETSINSLLESLKFYL